MTFARPEALFSLMLLLPLALLFLQAERRRRASLQRLGDPALIAQLLIRTNPQTRRRKAVLWLGAMALLLLALARPQWGSRAAPIEHGGLQVVMVLDVSASMLAQDVTPDRLDQAKILLRQLIDRLGPEDEIGLVLFAGESALQFSLTTDHASARAFLDAAGSNSVARPGTAIGAAIRTGIKVFDPARATRKVIVLASDGETHDEAAPAAAREAAGEGILIYAVGLGSASGSPIPEYNNSGDVIGYKRTVEGEVVVSRLDETLLRQVSGATGGAYFHHSDPSGLAAGLERLRSPAYLATIETQPVERFQLFLLPGFLLLLAAEILPEGRGRAGRTK